MANIKKREDQETGHHDLRTQENELQEKDLLRVGDGSVRQPFCGAPDGKTNQQGGKPAAARHHTPLKSNCRHQKGANSGQQQYY